MRISLIAAVADNGIIGRDGALPWRLPSDLKYFKSITMGKPIIMGRKTFESIGRPLPGRPNIVVSRNSGFSFEGIERFSSLGAAMIHSSSLGANEAMVIGGAAVFREALNFAQRLYLTEVHARTKGDVYFPNRRPEDWTEISRAYHSATSQDEFEHSFVVYERVTENQTL